MTVHSRGRPPKRADAKTRHAVVEYVDRVGPGVGMPTLAQAFPEVARGELAWIRGHYRRAYLRKHRVDRRSLEWTRPGTVWAADHSKPLCTISGWLASIFAVRDLAQPFQLAAIPMPDETTGPALAVLRVLVERHGAPLVLKVDNGPAFRGAEFKDYAASIGTTLLYSPPYYPQYNGAAEAGIGHIKTHTMWEATRHGRPTEWTCDDVYAAVERMNATTDPRTGLTRAERWDHRVRITKEERSRFLDDVRRYHEQQRRALPAPEHVSLDHWDESEIDRRAITRALIEHGYLTMRTRRIPPRFSRRKAANIT